MFEIKCYVGKREISNEKIKKIVVDNSVINTIVNNVNMRGALKTQNSDVR